MYGCDAWMYGCDAPPCVSTTCHSSQYKLKSKISKDKEEYEKHLKTDHKDEFLLNERMGGRVASSGFQNLLVNADNLKYIIAITNANIMKAVNALLLLDLSIFLFC